ncbi:class I SAM-dependent methyltransferase family protein [Candidatus Woesearchaeota archaeon]|nr:class I SAM-dependent methyltransferase family protein [Candidatus Woesearchaeota archaeon]
MKCLKVGLKDVENVKKKLAAEKLFVSGYKLLQENGFVYLPVSGKFETYPLIEKELPALRTRPLSLRDALSSFLTAAELEALTTSLDVVGDIAIIEVASSLLPKAELIATTLLEHQSNIHTVLKKEGEHAGVFRVRGYTYLAGKKTTETIHKESGVRLKLDVATVYFSPRLAHERLRIASLVGKGERVLVLFSGIGVYPLVLSKHSPAKEIVGIEINPDACRYGDENIALNKTTNVHLLRGDVRDVVPHIAGTFDRILLPLPKTAENFLPVALSVSKPGTILHLYAFLREEQFDGFGKEIIKKYPLKLLRLVKCGQTKPREFRVCLDLVVKK